MVRSSGWMAVPWRFVRLEGARPILQLDRPQKMADLIVDHVRRYPTSRAQR